MEDELSTRETLQAVLVADSFASTFWPITTHMPKALMPLANIPLIDYAVEFLVRNKVKELIVFCTVLPQHVEQYIAKVRLRVRSKECNIRCFQDDQCKSLGDVMRWLDQSSLIKSDFLLMTSDIVSNADLTNCLLKHKEKRKKDGNFILTKIFKQQPIQCRLRTYYDQLAVCLHEDEIVQLDDMTEQTEILYKLDFGKTQKYRIRNDLVDSGLCICTSELLSRFSDNFDFHTMDQVVKELLTNDVYTDKVAAYVVAAHEYLSRVSDPRTYDAIAKDVLTRWTHPIVLSSNILPYTAATTYHCPNSHLYKEDNVHIKPSSEVVSPAAIGSRTEIGENAKVVKSLVGRDCVIGQGAIVEQSHLWEGVVVEAGTTIFQAIICSNCIIGANCIIPSGCIIAPRVKLPSGTNLEPGTRVGDTPSRECPERTMGNGFIHWPCGDDVEKKKLIDGQNIGGKLKNWLEEDDWRSETSSDSSEEDIIYDGDGNPIQTASQPFIDEIAALVKDAMDENEEPDLLYQNINSTRHAQQRTLKECLSGIIRGLFSQIPKNIKTFIAKWAGLLKGFQMDSDDQLHIIYEAIKAVTDISCKNRFNSILYELYDQEIVEDRTILKWAQENTDEELRKLTADFVEWLQASDEEDEDES